MMIRCFPAVVLGAVVIFGGGSSATASADAETVFVDNGIGQLRVVSAATRDHNGQERAWVVDAARIDCVALAVALSGISCDAWNADFDARAYDRPGSEGRKTRALRETVLPQRGRGDGSLHSGEGERSKAADGRDLRVHQLAPEGTRADRGGGDRPPAADQAAARGGPPIIPQAMGGA